MKSILASVLYFSNLSESELIVLEQASIQKVFQPKQIVIIEGDLNAPLFIVKSGWLKVVKSSTSGREQILNYLGSGDIFNNVAVFTNAPNQATVICMEKSEILSIAPERMRQLITSNPNFAQRVIIDLASRLQHMVVLIEDLSLRSIEARLARFLLENVDRQQSQVLDRMTQVEMSARLGTVPEVLNRVFRKLKEEGVIEIDRQKIHVLDSDLLQLKVDVT